MGQEALITPTEVAGRFEVLPQKFDETVQGKEPVVLDLKSTLPEFFEKTDRIPRALEKIWRQAMDDVLADSRGIYCHKGGAQIQVYFYDVPPLMGKAKVDIVRRKIPELLKGVDASKVDLDRPLEVEKKPAPAKTDQRGPGDVEKLVKDGLGDNPSLDLVQLWCTRVLQSLTMSTQKMPLVKEMMDLVAKSDLSFQPLWSPSNQMLLGNAISIKGAVPPSQYNSGEGLRQDLAQLFGAVFHLYLMQSKGAASMMIVPLRSTSVNNRAFTELYVALLRRLAPEVQKNLVIEFRGIPKDNIPQSVKNMIEAAAAFMRAYIFETGFLTYGDYSKGYPKLDACSCDVSEVYIKDEDVPRLIRKYADHYAQRGIKTYMKSVASKEMLDIAIAAEFIYISGPVVQAAQKSAFAPKKLPL